MSRSSTRIRLNVTPAQVTRIDNETLAIEMPCETFDSDAIARILDAELQDMSAAQREYVIGHTLASCHDALQVAAIASLIRKAR